MNSSVERRFLALVACTVFVCIVPLFTLFLWLASDKAENEQRHNISVLLTANAKAMAKPLWDFDTESVRQIAAAVATDASVLGITVIDQTGDINISLPLAPLPPTVHTTSLSEEIVYQDIDGPKHVGTITLSFQPIAFFSSIDSSESILVAIFSTALLIVIGTTVFGNRMMVMRPLAKLTAAIDATHQHGSRHSVDWASNDEMGQLARSFNTMQIKLQQEENELKKAHRLATDTYNATPAMLYSLDQHDHIIGVSDHWVLATGYRRENVIGLPFAEFLNEGGRQSYEHRKDKAHTASRWEYTTKFVCADGSIMDVLIVESSPKISAMEKGVSLSVMTDITALKQAEARNRRQALTDHLTGLMNRQGFEMALDSEIAETDREGGSLACLFVDLDRFKWINDNLGHHAGDKTLQLIVSMIVNLLPENSIAARIGGDEFAILLRANNCEVAATDLATEICRLFEAPFIIKGTSTRLSASIGIALYPQHADNASELLQKADMAMYDRKRDGKNGLQVFDDTIGRNTRKRAEIEQTIEKALENEWFDAFLQPIIDLKTNRIIGYEALMRLHHPERGVMAPFDIIATAEETGAIHDIGKQVFGKAFEHFTALSALSGDNTSYLAVNLSPLQIEPSLPVWLASIVHLFNIDPSRIVIEITEATMLHDNPSIQTILRKIADFGCRIALDDFGTGYSSLSYLTRFMVNIVKIDQSFIRSMTSDVQDTRDRSRMLIEGITAISHKMKCTVVAEGIETEEQQYLLQAIGVDYGQGYLFDRPLSFEQLRDRILHKDMPVLKVV